MRARAATFSMLFLAHLFAAACTPGISVATGGSGGGATSATTIATGSTATGQGGGTCAPMCSGKQCGPDGCNGSCGTCSSADATCSTDGLCCTPTWSLTFPGNGQNLFASPDGTTVVGTHGGDVFRATCDGKAGPSTNVAGNGTTYVGEDSQRNIIGTGDTGSAISPHVFFKVATGSMPSIVPLAGTPTQFMWLGNRVGADIWTMGSAGTPNAPFLWKTDPANPSMTCTSDMGILSANGGWATAAVSDGIGGAFVATNGSPSAVYRVNCQLGCNCIATLLSNSFATGVGLRSLFVSGTNLYATGLSTGGGGIYRLDASTGQLLATFAYDPTPLLDGFTSVAADGVHVFAAGARGVDMSDPMLATGYSVLAILPIDFTSATQPQIVELKQTDFIWSLALSPLGAIVTGQKSPGTGFAALCTSAGVCPSDLL